MKTQKRTKLIPKQLKNGKWAIRPRYKSPWTGKWTSMYKNLKQLRRPKSGPKRSFLRRKQALSLKKLL